MLNGDPSRIDPDVPIEYQTEFLPYDRKWEFSKKRLRLDSRDRNVMTQQDYDKFAIAAGAHTMSM